MLGVDFAADQVVWQKYNPYPKIQQFPEEFVFIDRGEGAKEPFNHKDAISADLQQVLLPFPGFMSKLNVSGLEFIPLLRTGRTTGTVSFADLREDGAALGAPTGEEYVLAAHIRGKLKPNPQMAGEKDSPKEPAAAGKKAAPAGAAKPQPGVNVVLVADVDMISPAFFQLREQAEIPELGIRLDFDNVTFVLNTLDELAGDSRFLAVRSRRPKHRTLTRIEEQTKAAKSEAAEQRDKFYKECEKKEEDEQAQLDKRIADLQSRKEATSMDVINEAAIAMRDGQRRLESDRERFRQERDRAVTQIETKLNAEVRSVQKSAKWLAVLLPPILPLLVGAYVFLARRVQEREGVSRRRLR